MSAYLRPQALGMVWAKFLYFCLFETPAATAWVVPSASGGAGAYRFRMQSADYCAEGAFVRESVVGRSIEDEREALARMVAVMALLGAYHVRVWGVESVASAPLCGSAGVVIARGAFGTVMLGVEPFAELRAVAVGDVVELSMHTPAPIREGLVLAFPERSSSSRLALGVHAAGLVYPVTCFAEAGLVYGQLAPAHMRTLGSDTPIGWVHSTQLRMAARVEGVSWFNAAPDASGSEEGDVRAAGEPSHTPALVLRPLSRPLVGELIAGSSQWQVSGLGRWVASSARLGVVFGANGSKNLMEKVARESSEALSCLNSESGGLESGICVHGSAVVVRSRDART